MGWYYVVVMGYIQRLERVMIKSTANSNVKSTPSTPIRTGGVVGETPTETLPKFFMFPYTENGTSGIMGKGIKFKESEKFFKIKKCEYGL